MRKRSIIIIFAAVFIGTLLLTSGVSAISSADIKLKRIVKLEAEDVWGSTIYDGENLWMLETDWRTGQVYLLTFSPINGSLLSNQSLSVEFFGDIYATTYIQGKLVVITSEYNSTLDRYQYFLYTINLAYPNNASYIDVSIPEEYYLIDITAQGNNIFAILGSKNQSGYRIVKIDPTDGTVTGATQQINFNTTEMHYLRIGYIGDSLVVYTGKGEIYDMNGKLLCNATKDLEGKYNITFTEVISLSNTPDGKDFAILMYANYHPVGEFSYNQEYGYFVMIYQTQPSAPSQVVDLGSTDPAEPVTSSSIAVSTIAAASASASAIAVSTSSSATTAGAATTAGTSVGATTTSVLPAGRGGESNKLWNYGLKIGKSLAKLIKRKKKKEEERFEKPSYLKLLIYLAIASAVVALALIVFRLDLLVNIFSVASIVFIGVGLGFGSFGFLIGYLLVRAIKKNLLPPATTFGKLGLYASIIGGAYGIGTSILKFLAIVGIVSLVGIVIIGFIGFAFAMAAYGYTLGLYS